MKDLTVNTKYSTIKFLRARGERSPTGLPVYELTGIPAKVNIEAWCHRLEDLGCCGIYVSSYKQPPNFLKINFWATPEAIEKLTTTFNPQPKQLSLF